MKKQHKAKGGKGKPNNKGKGKGRAQDDTRFQFRESVISLTDRQIPVALRSALGLAPGFRPTPKPVTDSEVTKSLRKFAGSIRNKAFERFERSVNYLDA